MAFQLTSFLMLVPQDNHESLFIITVPKAI